MDGRLREQFETAMRAVFEYSTLEQWLGYAMDVKLGEITPANVPFTTTVFTLVSWAESAGRLDELIGKAGAASPDNPYMKAFIADWREAAARPKTSPARPATPPAGIDQGALRRAIASAFSLTELEELCADVQDQLSKDGYTEPLSLDIIGANGGLQNTVLALVRYLERRGHLDALVTVVRARRPGII
jgi:hypothetical protein